MARTRSRKPRRRGAPARRRGAPAGRRVALAVTGGIAAYKAAGLASRLVQAGSEVRVVMTEAATRFVTPLTFESLTDRPVATSLWEKPGGTGHAIGHVALAEWAEAAVVAPCTADAIGKLAGGLADDLVSTFLLAFGGPVLLAPAMNARMWAHPAVRENVALLRRRGVRLVGPVTGRLASGAVGAGRMAEPEAIAAALEALLKRRRK